MNFDELKKFSSSEHKRLMKHYKFEKNEDATFIVISHDKNFTGAIKKDLSVEVGDGIIM